MKIRLVIAWTLNSIALPLSLHAAVADSSAMPPLQSASGPELELKHPQTDIWQDGVGNGFKSGSQSLTLASGTGYGVRILGTKESHDMALASLSYGYMWGPVKGAGHWYKGNWELRGELWGAIQFDPSNQWAVGLTPHLRYNFATGTSLVPYLDVGAGLSATSIREPDLGQVFEFNLQAAGGVRWFITHDVALSLELRLLHLSDAGMTVPNLGVNNVSGLLGVSWFF